MSVCCIDAIIMIIKQHDVFLAFIIYHVKIGIYWMVPLDVHMMERLYGTIIICCILMGQQNM